MNKSFIFFVKNFSKIISQHFLWSKYNLYFDEPSAHIPATAYQRRIYHLDHKLGKTSAYQINTIRTFKGALDIHALKLILTEMVKKHEILRTTFYADSKGVYQKIHQPFTVKIDLIDIRYLSLDEQSRLIDKIAKKNLSLDQVPLFKITVFHQDDDRFKVLFKFHQIIWDNWSNYMFFDSLQQAYNHYLKTSQVHIQEPSMQYQDYARLEYKRTAKIPVKTIDFFEHYFEKLQANDIKLINKNHTNSTAASTYHAVIGSDLRRKIEQSCKAQGSSPHVFLLTAFLVLLRKYSISDSVNTLVPRFRRFHSRIKQIYGPVFNSLPVSVELTPDMHFSDVLLLVRDNLNLLFGYDDIPLERIMETLNQEQNQSLEYLFSYIPLEWTKDVHLNHLEISDETWVSKELPYVMTFYVAGVEHEGGSQWGLNIAYQTDKINHVMAKIIAEHYLSILDAATKNTSIALDAIDLFCKHYTNPVNYLNSPALSAPFKSVIQTFLESVTRFKDNECIRIGEQSLNYQQFYHQVLAVFKLLKQKGIEKNRVVVISGEKDERMLAAIIAVLAANMTFYLLDSKINPRYIKSALIEIEPLFGLLADNESSSHFELIKEAIDNRFEVILLEKQTEIDDFDAIHADFCQSMSEIQPDDIAYIIFTSGSTGSPKGILGSHHGLSHFIHWQINQFNINDQDICALITGIAFDVCLREILTPLLSGATLLLPAHAGWMHEQNFFKWISLNKVTFFHTVPTVFSMFMLELEQYEKVVVLPELRWVFFAGEPLHASLINHIREKTYGFTNIVNLYGPSETVLAKMYYIVPFKPQFHIQPIGKPMKGVEVYILNQNMHPCGVGEPGEIVIRPPFHCLGYLKPGSLQFKNNPYSDDSMDKLYFTGDIGFYDTDGLVHICGRVDNQVKINGIRIELDTINSVIKNYPNIESCAVICHDKNQHKQLIAYVTLKDKKSAHHELLHLLKNFIHRELPEYMVPKTIIILDNMPRLASGKIDIKSLLKEVVDVEELSVDTVPPVTKTEQVLHDIWSHILNQPTCSITATHEDLGIDSINILQCILEIKNQFGIALLPDILTKQDNIQKLAFYIDTHLFNQADDLSMVKKSVGELRSILATYPPVVVTHASLIDELDPEHILLTGALDYLGRYVLLNLLVKYKTARVFCLIHTSMSVETINWLYKTLVAIGLDMIKDEFLRRVVLINSDGTDSHFHLNMAQYEQLATTIDVIYLCHATPQAIASFESQKHQYMDTTYHMTLFAAYKKIKPISLVVSASLFPSTEYYSKTGFSEEDSIDFNDDVDIYGVYAQCQWMAHWLIDDAKDAGIPVSIYRVGHLCGDSSYKNWSSYDFIYALIESIYQFKAIPDLAIKLDLLPVNLASQMIVEIEYQERYQNKIYHLINPHRISMKELQSLLSERGRKIRMLPYTEWKKVITDAILSGKHVPLAPFMDLLPQDASSVPRFKYDRHFSVSKAQKALKPSTVDFNYIDAALLMHYINQSIVR